MTTENYIDWVCIHENKIPSHHHERCLQSSDTWLLIDVSRYLALHKKKKKRSFFKGFNLKTKPEYVIKQQKEMTWCMSRSDIKYQINAHVFLLQISTLF